jgi:DNA-binding NtrC family response regulator
VAEHWRDLLRVARGGTLFLDNVGRLDRELQRILLAAAQGPPSQVRVIAATVPPAEDLVRAGALDADLFAWLGLFRIPLPPLRGRPEDIAAQAYRVVGAVAEGQGPAAGFAPGVLEVLQRLPWECNTAQLEAVLRQALAAKGDGTELRLDDLPAWVREVPPDAPLPEPVPHPGDLVAAADTLPPLEVAAEEYERRLLRALLERRAGPGPHPSRPDPTGGVVRPDHHIDGEAQAG